MDKPQKDYVKYIREKVGHETIILNYAGCIITNEKEQLLLQKRTDCNEWGFLGGIIEIGESAHEAANREVLEESGYNIEIHNLFGIYTKYFTTYSNGDSVQTILHMFEANIIGGSSIINNSETIELKWFAKTELPILFNDQHNDILNDYLTGKKGFFR